MHFASINSTNPWNFGENFSRIGDFENLSFFESAILKKKKKMFASPVWKLVQVSWVARMGRNFDDYPGFQLFFTQIKHFCPEYYILVNLLPNDVLEVSRLLPS